MLSQPQARALLLAAYPSGEVQRWIEYEELFIFQLFIGDDGEAGFDPFYSVNRRSEEVAEFSIITDGDIAVIVDRFRAFEGKDT